LLAFLLKEFNIPIMLQQQCVNRVLQGCSF
jgi:hypothetical protein